MGQKMARLNDIGTLMRYDNLDKKHRRARQGSAARRLIVDGNAVVEIELHPASPAPQDVALENTSHKQGNKAYLHPFNAQ